MDFCFVGFGAAEKELSEFPSYRGFVMLAAQ